MPRMFVLRFCQLRELVSQEILVQSSSHKGYGSRPMAQIRLQRPPVKRIPTSRIHQFQMTLKLFGSKRDGTDESMSLSQPVDRRLFHPRDDGVERVVIVESTEMVRYK